MTEITLKRTCYACPEQYDALDEAGNVVGYLRLRHGHFTVDFPDASGTEVYSASPKGDGIFEHDERQGYLDAAVAAIRQHLAAVPLRAAVGRFPLDMAMVSCADCGAGCYPADLGEALDWALAHKCEPQP